MDKNKRKQEYIENCIELSDNQYQCKKCGKIFNSKMSWTKHFNGCIRKSLDEINENLEHEKFLKNRYIKTNSGFICNGCRKQFKNERQIVEHCKWCKDIIGEEKYLQRRKEHYNKCNEKWRQHTEEQSKEIILKINKTCQEKYKCNWGSQSESAREKQSNIHKNRTKQEEKIIAEKRLNTKLKHFGRKNYFSFGTEEYKENFLLKHGVDNPSKLGINIGKRYIYKNMNFHSSQELKYYLFCKENNINIIRNMGQISFEYIFNNIKHTYIPDFICENQCIEIKGDQFITDNDTWVNPFDHSQDELYEAKHQCAIANNVKIIKASEIEDFIGDRYDNIILESKIKKKQEFK